jgi:phospholipid/cholesterol/gamma-HCH transport system ATP-binding protein
MRRFSFGKGNKDKSEGDWQSLPSYPPANQSQSQAPPTETQPVASVPPPADEPTVAQPPADVQWSAPAGEQTSEWAPSTDAWASGPDDPAPLAPSADAPTRADAPTQADTASLSWSSQPGAQSHPAQPAYEPPAPPPGNEPPAAAPAWEPPPTQPEPVIAASAPQPQPADPEIEWETPARQESPTVAESRVSVIAEQPPRPAPPPGASEEEYKWHTYKVYPSGRPDAVEFIDTYKAFGKNRILRGVNMGLPEGMVSMILGPSGTGKSVCIKHMVGLLYPDDGDILVHGESVPNMPDDDLFEMRKKFGLLFQDGALFGSMNLYDNVAFPLRQHTEKGEDEIEDIVMRRLNEVGLGHSRDKYPNELSGGMRKRAGFARALVLGPDIVLFDEPDSGLDPVRTALLGELILEIHRDMMEEAKAAQKPHLPTFAVITHDIMSARRVADYINVLWKGRIVEAGPAEDMLNSENPFIRQFLAGESQGPLTMD